MEWVVLKGGWMMGFIFRYHSLLWTRNNLNGLPLPIQIFTPEKIFQINIKYHRWGLLGEQRQLFPLMHIAEFRMGIFSWKFIPFLSKVKQSKTTQRNKIKWNNNKKTIWNWLNFLCLILKTLQIMSKYWFLKLRESWKALDMDNTQKSIKKTFKKYIQEKKKSLTRPCNFRSIDKWEKENLAMCT